MRSAFLFFGGVEKATIFTERGVRSAHVTLKRPERANKVAEQVNNMEAGDGELTESCVLSCKVVSSASPNNDDYSGNVQPQRTSKANNASLANTSVGKAAQKPTGANTEIFLRGGGPKLHVPRVVGPPPKKAKKPCPNFMATGVCQWGAGCYDSHGE